MSKDDERKVQTSETLIEVAMIRLEGVTTHLLAGTVHGRTNANLRWPLAYHRATLDGPLTNHWLLTGPLAGLHLY